MTQLRYLLRRLHAFAYRDRAASRFYRPIVISVLVLACVPMTAWTQQSQCASPLASSATVMSHTEAGALPLADLLGSPTSHGDATEDCTLHCPGGPFNCTPGQCNVVFDVPCGCDGGNVFHVACYPPGYGCNYGCPPWQPCCGPPQGPICCTPDYHCNYGVCRAEPLYESYCLSTELHVEPPTTGDCDIEGPATSGMPSSPASAGACCAPSAAGNPVSVTTGTMFLAHTDAVVGDFVFSRSFNGGRLTRAERYGMFGPGWNASFESRLIIRPAVPRTIEARRSDGNPQYYVSTEYNNPDFVRLDSMLPWSTESWIERVLVDGVVTGYRRVFRAGGNETYDPNGQLQSASDRFGVQTLYQRDAQGRLSSVTRLGRAITIEYDGSDTWPARLRGPGGELLATYSYLDYAGKHWLETVQYNDESGSGYRYGYDGWGNLKSVVDLQGKLIEFHTYAGFQALTSQRNLDDETEKLTFQYDTVTHRTTVTDARQKVTTYEYTNVRGTRRVTKITGPCSSCGSGELQEWSYDEYGRVQSHKDGEGHLTTYTYDPITGDLLTETRRPNPAGSDVELTTKYTHHPDGRLSTRTDPRGGLTTWTYENIGTEEKETITQLVTSTPSPRTRQTVVWRNNIGKPRLLIDPRLKETRLFYTPETGDLDHVIDPAGKETHFTYDALGRRTQVIPPVTTPPALEPTFEYNVRGQVRRIIDPTDPSKYTLITYDRGGRRIEVRDPLQVGDPIRRTEHNYDDYGRLWRTRRWMAGPGGAMPEDTEFHYDVMSNLAWIKDARGKQTTFEYDDYTRVNNVFYPPDGTETRKEHFTYYRNGLLKTRTDRRDVTTTYTYDGLGRLTGKSYAGGSVPTPAVTFGYDGASNLNLATDGGTILTWTHNLTGEPESATNQQEQVTLRYGYDDAGNRVSLNARALLSLTYDYDDVGRPWHIFRGTETFTFGYDNASRRRSLTYPNGAVATLTPDALSRLDLLEVQGAAGTIARFDYEYDAVGNRLRKATPSVDETYTYDDVYQLDTVSRNSNLVEDLGFDLVGNRNSTLALPDPANWLYSNRNELLTAGTTNFTYDLNGNLATKNDGTDPWTYEWDAENRLTRVTRNGAEVARHRYDALGRRVGKTASGVTTTYTYDGEDIVRETVGSTSRVYVHGPGIDEPLARVTDSTATYLHADGLGSIVNHTNSAGSVVYSRGYDAFGNLETGANEAGYAFTGREWDPETGLYYYRARYYDPTTGRFVSEDPLGFRAGPNFYAYVNNNPAVRVDPYGLEDGNLNLMVPGPNGETADGRTCQQPRQPFYDCYRNCMRNTAPPTGFTEGTTAAGIANQLSKVPIPACRAIGGLGLAVNLSRITACALVCGDSCVRIE